MAVEAKPHPAKFTHAILDRAYERLLAELAGGVDADRPYRILDPFAGTGRVHRVADRFSAGSCVESVGVDLEPEWAAHEPRTLVGDATALPFDDDSFDCLLTSPCYGNRMADSHNAADYCKRCAGAGVLTDPGGDVTCPVCKSSRLSKRNTYTHTLGRKPSAGSAAVLRWGREYRTLHTAAWNEADRVLRPGSLVLVNVKNHVETVGRGDDKRVIEHPVTEWHLNLWLSLGAKLLAVDEIRTPGQRQGANRDARADVERLLVLRSRSVTW